MAFLGNRLRELRVNRNLTLKQVSDETRLSVSFISLVERDKVSISVDNLERLARFYNIRLVHLFQGVEDSSVFIMRASSYRQSLNTQEIPHSAVTLFPSRMGSRMEPQIVQMTPGDDEIHYRFHDGDIFLYVIEGKIRLRSEKGEIEELTPGDTAYYFGFPGRIIENISLDQNALILLVSIPPDCLHDKIIERREDAISGT